MHKQQQQPSPQEHFSRLSYVLLIIIAALLCIYFYLIPFLSYIGSMEAGYSQEHKEAYALAQNVQAYRKKHPSKGNYAQAAIKLLYDDAASSKWDISDVYEGFDDENGENSTHSEQFAYK